MRRFWTRWARKQRLAAPARFYGDGGTIHATEHLDVEVHAGKVVAVWFRCQVLPFEQHDVDLRRAVEMGHMQAPAGMTGVEILDG